MEAVCNRDCFHCKFEDCICDDLFYEDYAAQKDIDLISGAKEYKTSYAVRLAQKKYREENREKWKEYNKKSRQKKSRSLRD